MPRHTAPMLDEAGHIAQCAWWPMTHDGLKAIHDHRDGRGYCAAVSRQQRTASFGFETVRIAPQVGSLTHGSGVLAHPKGDIVVDLRADANGDLYGHVILPKGLTGVFHYAGKQLALAAGRQEIDLRDVPLESLE